MAIGRRLRCVIKRVPLRLYWGARAWWARVECRLRGYPPRPPLDDILRRIEEEHPEWRLHQRDERAG